MYKRKQQTPKTGAQPARNALWDWVIRRMESVDTAGAEPRAWVAASAADGS